MGLIQDQQGTEEEGHQGAWREDYQAVQGPPIICPRNVLYVWGCITVRVVSSLEFHEKGKSMNIIMLFYLYIMEYKMVPKFLAKQWTWNWEMLELDEGDREKNF